MTYSYLNPYIYSYNFWLSHLGKGGGDHYS